MKTFVAFKVKCSIEHAYENRKEYRWTPGSSTKIRAESLSTSLRSALPANRVGHWTRYRSKNRSWSALGRRFRAGTPRALTWRIASGSVSASRSESDYPVEPIAARSLHDAERRSVPQSLKPHRCCACIKLCVPDVPVAQIVLD